MNRPTIAAERPASDDRLFRSPGMALFNLSPRIGGAAEPYRDRPITRS
jgi:hypothetical protein